MDVYELADRLRDMLSVVAHGERLMTINLFAIKYAEYMREDGFDFDLLLEEAGISENYKTEIYRGLRLSKYVDVKPEFSNIPYDAYIISQE